MLANDPVTQARIDLTTALRAAARHGLNEGVCNHFSMTVPGREELFLVNPQGLHWSDCLLYTSPSPRDRTRSRMPSSA